MRRRVLPRPLTVQRFNPENVRGCPLASVSTPKAFGAVRWRALQPRKCSGLSAGERFNPESVRGCPLASASTVQEPPIQREAVFFRGKTKYEEQEREPGNYVTTEVKQRVVQKMTKGDDNKHHSERDQGVAGA